jgi:hypothetical protein
MVRIFMFFLRLSKTFPRFYSRITSTKSPSFSKKTFSASLANFTVLLQSHDCSCYVSRRILAHLPLRLLKHTDLRAKDFAPCFDL